MFASHHARSGRPSCRCTGVFVDALGASKLERRCHRLARSVWPAFASASAEALCGRSLKRPRRSRRAPQPLCAWASSAAVGHWLLSAPSTAATLQTGEFHDRRGAPGSLRTALRPDVEASSPLSQAGCLRSFQPPMTSPLPAHTSGPVASMAASVSGALPITCRWSMPVGADMTADVAVSDDAKADGVRAPCVVLAQNLSPPRCYSRLTAFVRRLAAACSRCKACRGSSCSCQPLPVVVFGIKTAKCWSEEDASFPPAGVGSR